MGSRGWGLWVLRVLGDCFVPVVQDPAAQWEGGSMAGCAPCTIKQAG